MKTPQWLLRSRIRQGAYFHHSEVKLFADDIILYIENSKDYTHTQLLEPINEFSKIAGYKVNTQKSVAFIYRKNWTIWKEIRKTTDIFIKRIIYLRIHLTKNMNTCIEKTTKHCWKKF